MVAPAAKTYHADSKTRIPLTVKLKARSLYLIHGLPHAEIAKQCGLKPQSIRNLAFSEGWTKTKAQTKAALVKRADARAQEMIDEVSTAIAVESEEIAMSGLKRARESAESNGETAAKDFQAWTGGARNLVNIARACRGLDGKPGESAPGAGGTINLAFFVGNISAANTAVPSGNAQSISGADTSASALPMRAGRECKTVGPVLDVSATTPVP